MQQSILLHHKSYTAIHISRGHVIGSYAAHLLITLLGRGALASFRSQGPPSDGTHLLLTRRIWAGSTVSFALLNGAFQRQTASQRPCGGTAMAPDPPAGV